MKRNDAEFSSVHDLSSMRSLTVEQLADMRKDGAVFIFIEGFWIGEYMPGVQA